VARTITLSFLSLHEEQIQISLIDNRLIPSAQAINSSSTSTHPLPPAAAAAATAQPLANNRAKKCNIPDVLVL
jgi:hypothetical protein